MKVKITLSRTNEQKDIDIASGSIIEDLLKKLNLKPDTVITMDDKKPIPIDSKLYDKQEILIIQVSSGG